MKVSRLFLLMLLWSFSRLYSSSKFFRRLALGCRANGHNPCSLNRLFSCFTMDSQTVALCLLLMGWWSFHVAIRKWISASDQLGERLLVPALFTSLESSSTRLELWYWVMTTVGKSDRVNMGCCSKNSLCQSRKMYGPRTASPTLVTYWWNNEGWPKTIDLLR